MILAKRANGETSVMLERVEMALLLVALRGFSASDAISMVDALIKKSEA